MVLAAGCGRAGRVRHWLHHRTIAGETVTTRLSGPDLFNMEIGLGDTVELVDLPISGRVFQELKHGAIILPVYFETSPAVRRMGDQVMMEPTGAYLVERLCIRADDERHPSPQGMLTLNVAGREYGPWRFHTFYRSVDSWYIYELDPAIFIGRLAVFFAQVALDAPYERRQYSVVLRGKLARPR